MSRHVTMPKWPAYVLGAALVASAYPAVTTPPPAQGYRALGQEAGWSLAIADGRIDYTGDHGETRISVAQPAPLIGSNGRRYETSRLTVDIAYLPCNDAISGQAYVHQVVVIADGRTVRGCGGQPQPGRSG